MVRQIDYYVTLNSPWTHLGAARIAAIAERYGATLRVHPVDFRDIIFPSSGGLPVNKRSPQRQAYRMQELRRWRDHLGVPIHLTPRHAPFDESLAAQCVIAARETIGETPAVALAHRILKALWEEEANPADSATLARLIGEAGLEPEPLMELGAESRWATRRRTDSREALDRGVFGAPTYAIGPELFWGQDRLDFVERCVAGG